MTIGEDFHSQVGDGKIRTTLYKVRWEGYDKKDDTWEPITYLQGYATMVKSFKESHAKDLEKLATDRQCQEAKTATDDLVNTHVNPTYPDVVRMWRQFHGCPASGGLIERVFFSDSSPMMMTHTGNTSSLQRQEVDWRMEVREVIVIWTYSVVLVWFV